MSNTITKSVGFILLIGGVAVIGWTMLYSFNIFTGKSPVSEVFKVPQEKTINQKAGSQDIEAQLQQALGEQLKGVLPADVLPKTLNLAAWSMLAGILILGGGQLAGLGIKLIK